MTELASDFVREFWGVLGEMSPYLLFGFLAAGLLSVFISPGLVERHLGGRGFGPIVKASAFGVPLPLCSCGVIPVAASLRRHGASRAATTSFLLSTPQTGVDSILVTFSLLGPVFAVFRPVAAFITGLVGGAVVGAAVPEEKRNGRVPACHAECCEPTSEKGRFVRGLQYGFVTLAGDIGVALLAGLVIAGVIGALVPEDFFAPVLGGGILAMLIMMAVGIPVYVCATASVPVAAALIAKGVAPGAALVFLMTGPATNAATIAVIGRTMGRRTAALYLATVAVAALASGLLLDAILPRVGTGVGAAMPWMMPAPVKTAAAVLLLAVLAHALVKARTTTEGHEGHTASAPEQAVLAISGMTCSHCAEAVRAALVDAPGVASVEVDLHKGRALVRGAELDLHTLINAVEGVGYSAEHIQTNAQGEE